MNEFFKILAHLTDNPNAPDEDGITPIHWAAFNGHIVIAKILVPLADNPINALNRDGKTPLHYAAMKGHTEIVKFFAPLTGNPIAVNNYGETPKMKMLVPLTDNPNAPVNIGGTPSVEAHWGAVRSFHCAKMQLH